MEIIDCVFVSFRIESRAFRHKFHILQAPHDMILGLDFLQQNKAVVDFTANSLRIGKQSFSLTHPVSRSCIVYLAEPKSLPPQSVSTVKIFFKSKLSQKDSTFHLEPFKSFKQSFPELDLVPLVTTPTTAFCQVVNSSRSHVQLPKRLPIGFAYTVQPAAVLNLDELREVEGIEIEAVGDLLASKFARENPLTFDLSASKLSGGQQDDFQTFLAQNADRFADNLAELGCTNLHFHRIDTGDAPPASSPHYRQSITVKEEMNKQIQELLTLGIIEPSTSQWRSGVVMVRKKCGAFRFAIDFRKLNAVTEKISFPMPRVEDVWDAIGASKAKYFSTLDLASGFWQIPLDPTTKHKTSFVTADAQYQFTRLPFGLSNAPISFQQTMSTLLRGIVNKFVLVYIDDLIIFSETYDEHKRHLEEVFSRLRLANLTLKPSKCQFASSSVEYLGHFLSEDGIRPNPEKTQCIQNFPVPTTQKQVRQFLGLAQYYRRFVKNFSKIATPLHNLLQKNVVWDWSPDCQKSFEILRDALASPPILAYPNPHKEFILTTDASEMALSYILGQKDDQGREHVIAYGGRSLRKPEKKYPIHELEALAVIEGVRHFHVYLAHSHFTVHTDNNAVSYIKNLKLDRGRLARYAIMLQSYDMEVVHRAGKANQADALSRIAHTSINVANTDQNLLAYDLFFQEEHIGPVTVPTVLDLEPFDLPKEQQECAEIGPLYTFLSTDVLPDDVALAKKITAMADLYTIQDDILYNVHRPRAKSKITASDLLRRVVVPKARRLSVMQAYHDDFAHQGFDRCYAVLNLKYYWPKMYTDVYNYVTSCTRCQLARKGPTSSSPLHPLPVEGLFHRFHVDFIGPLKESKSGFKYIFVMTDSFSKWVEARPTKDQSARTAAQILFEEVISRFGAPRTLVSDRGSAFMSQLFSTLSKFWGIKVSHTSPYHPETNAACERFNGFIGEKLRTMVNTNQDNWDLLLPAVLMAYRGTPATRSTDFSPFYVLFGQEMRLPIDNCFSREDVLPPPLSTYVDNLQKQYQQVREIAKANLEERARTSKASYDRLKNVKPSSFVVGDLVLMQNKQVPVGFSAKLTPKRKGPYRIVGVHSNDTYTVQLVETDQVHKARVHSKLLSPYVKRTSAVADNPDENNDTANTSSDLPKSGNKIPREDIDKLLSWRRSGAHKLFKFRYRPSTSQKPVILEASSSLLPEPLVSEFCRTRTKEGRVKNKRKRKRY